jgi:CBS domain-containing protein
MRVGELMTSPAVTVWPWVSIPDAGRLLLRRGVTALVVRDGEGRLVGIVSRSDLLRNRIPPDHRALPKPAAVPASEPPRTVADVMSTDVVSLPPTADAADAATLMLERRIRSVPVVEDGRVLGVVSVSDLLRASVRLDARIADAVRARLREHLGQHGVWAVQVDDGVVTILGAVAPEDRPVVHQLAEAVPGVVRVRYADQADEMEPSPAAGPSTLADVTAPDRGEQPTTHRRGLVVLDLEDCLERLRSAPIGRLAFVHKGGPVIVPVTHGMDGTNVVFRSTWGSKLEVAQAAGSVAFEVDGVDESRRTGWSVLVKGTASIAYDANDIERFDRLDVPAWVGFGDDAMWIVLRAEEISGREIVVSTG